jgi:hypothetical protein
MLIFFKINCLDCQKKIQMPKVDGIRFYFKRLTTRVSIGHKHCDCDVLLLALSHFHTNMLSLSLTYFFLASFKNMHDPHSSCLFFHHKYCHKDSSKF